MKLLTRTSLIFAAALLLVLAAGGYIFFSFFSSLVDEEVTENMYREKKQIVAYLSSQAEPATFMAGSQMTWQPVSGACAPDAISDTLIYDTDEEEQVPYRILRFCTASAGGTNYEVTLMGSLFEADDLVEGTLLLLILIAAGLLAALLTINIWLSGRLWRPFYRTIQFLREYRSPSQPMPAAARTGTREFDTLNESIAQMTRTIDSEFTRLKEFTENAAHELQTPLAVIMAQSEMLIQDPNLTGDQAKVLAQMHTQAQRLSRINKALLLLARIENKQFVPVADFNFSGLLLSRLAELEELFASRQLVLHTKVDPDVQVSIHPALAEVIVNNLLANAIRYTSDGGKVEVSLSANTFEVRNSGTPFAVDSSRLFERFYKVKPDSESTGLGLAICQGIARESGFRLQYRFEGGMHVFALLFSQGSA